MTLEKIRENLAVRISFITFSPKSSCSVGAIRSLISLRCVCATDYFFPPHGASYTNLPIRVTVSTAWLRVDWAHESNYDDVCGRSGCSIVVLFAVVVFPVPRQNEQHQVHTEAKAINQVLRLWTVSYRT